MEARRKAVHILTLLLALLLRYLSPTWAALLVFAALLFNLFFIPRLMRSVQRSPGAGLDAGIVLFPASLLILIFLYGGRMEVVAGAWALMAAGDGLAGLVGKRFGRLKLPWNPEKSWAGFVAFVVFGTPAAVFLMDWCYSPLGFAALVGSTLGVALICAVVESMPWPVNDNLTVPLVGGTLFYIVALSADRVPLYFIDQVSTYMLWGAIGVNLGAALVAYYFRLLTGSATLVATVIGFVLFIFQPWGWLLLVVFFALGTATTQLGLRRKQAMAAAPEHPAARNASQVLAKGMVPAVFAFLAACGGSPELYQLALVASIATALSDTIQTEVGMLLGRRPFLPTTFQPVPAGTPGAVSLEGTLAGVGASALLAGVALLIGLIEWEAFPIVLIAAFAGTFLESYLGASPKRHQWLGGAGLNFTATLTGALAAMILAGLFPR